MSELFGDSGRRRKGWKEREDFIFNRIIPKVCAIGLVLSLLFLWVRGIRATLNGLTNVLDH
jgi:hypothetical protein